MRSILGLAAVLCLTLVVAGCNPNSGPVQKPGRDAGTPGCPGSRKCVADCCAADQLCVSGVCTTCACAANQMCGEDPCGNSCGTCDFGKACDATTKTCVAACPTGQTPCGKTCCQPGQVCNNGACGDRCSAGQTPCGDTACCTTGQTCDNGTCATINLCAAATCNPGETCDPADGYCKCSSDSCPTDQLCSQTRLCVNNTDPCLHVQCADATLPHCQNGACVCTPNPNSCGVFASCNNDVCQTTCPAAKQCVSVCCPSNQNCDNGNCVTICIPSCGSHVCGDNGCGGSCGACGANQTCSTTTGQCVCAPSCGSHVCGDNGCGGSCGSCGTGDICNTATGQCVPCTPTCGTRVCGDDGCNGVCGTCGTNQTCNASTGHCDACTPTCGSKVCGDNGCGGVCGTCGTNQTCNTATGQCVCVPSCGSHVCGDNGCGGVCGTCGAYATCNASGQCVACTPTCGAKVCGDDGCGGVCGTCGTNQTCNSSGQCTSTQVACDPLTQIPCTSSQGCYYTSTGNFCATAGLGAEGDSCNMGPDCARGNDCGIDTSGNHICYTYCDPAGANTCLNGETCQPFPDGTGYCGSGSAGCDPLTQQPCTSSQGCYWVSGTDYACNAPGLGAEWDTCNSGTDCKRGEDCASDGTNSYCFIYCNPASATNTCPSGETCQPFPDASGTGYCGTGTTCNPVAQTPCSAHSKYCYWNDSASDYACTTTHGTKATGSSCTKDSDCVPSDGCVTSKCLKYCYQSGGTDCGTKTCIPITGDASYGVCN